MQSSEIIIWHIADIHIRYKCYEDILYAIDQLMDQIKAESLARTPIENQMIVIAGDIFENKDTLKSDDLICFNNIMNKLKNIKILIIPGNHDISRNHTDAITAALDSYTNQNIYKFINSGIYTIPGINNIEFHILSPLDNKIPEYECTTKNLKIAVIHEPIKGCKLYGSTTLNNARFDSVMLTSKYDIVMAGDMHKHQYLDSGKRVAYSGSLIQKNKGENLNHGCIKWIISENIKSEFIRFKLRSAYLVIDIINDKFDYPDQTLFERVKYLEIRHINSKNINDIMKEISTKYNSIIHNVIDNNIFIEAKNSLEKQNSDKNSDIEIIQNSDKNNEIVKIEINENIHEFNPIEYLGEIKNTKDLEDILRIHEKYTNEEVRRNKWKLCYLSWSNLFCYGEKNCIDFTKFKGINSIIGKNKIGKSSIIDILIFVLYNENLRSDAKNMINQNSNKYEIKCCFDVNEDKYIIIKQGNKNSGNQISTVQLLLVKDNNYIDVSKDSIKDTYKFIESLIGTSEEITNINIATQDHVPIINKKPKDQLDELYKYFNLNIYKNIETEISKILLSDKKALKILQNMMSSNFQSKTISEPIKKIDELKNIIDNLNIKKNELENNIKKYKKEQYKLSSELITLNETEKKIDTKNIKLTDDFDIVKLNENLIKIDELMRGYYKTRNLLDLENELQTLEYPDNDLDKLKKELENNKKNIKDLYNLIQHVKYSDTEYINKIQYDDINNIQYEYEDNLKKIKKIESLIRYNVQNPKTNLTKDDLRKIKIKETKDELICQLVKNAKKINDISYATKTKNEIELLVEQFLLKKQNLMKFAIVKKVENLKFNDDCDCCKNNKMFIGNNETEKQLMLIENEILDLVKHRNYLNNIEIQNKIDILDDKEYYRKLHIEELKIKNDELLNKIEIFKVKDIIFENEKNKKAIEILENRNVKLQNMIKAYNIMSEINRAKSNIKIDENINKLKFENFKCKLLHNENINNKIQIIIDSIKKIESELKNINNMLLENNALLVKSEIYDKTEKDIKNLVNKIELYTKYRKLIDAEEGMPFKILEKILISVQHNVNKILSEITDFTILIKLKSKKINIKISNNLDKTCIPAKQGSGFQKFIIDLALRLSLANEHPYLPNFFIIDEGFGCMDADHLNNTCDFLTELNEKNNFDWMLIISHIQELHHISNNYIIIDTKDCISTIQSNAEINVPIIVRKSKKNIDKTNKITKKENKNNIESNSEQNIKQNIEQNIEPNIETHNEQIEQTLERVNIETHNEQIEDIVVDGVKKFICKTCNPDKQLNRTSKSKHLISKSHLERLKK